MDSTQTKTIVHPLYEGTFSVGVDKSFNRIHKDDPPEKGALKISINPFLFISENRKILFDVGIGDFSEYTSTDIIKENLAQHDLTEYDITDIFVSHLHFDHIGGLAGRTSGYWELTFPEATLWVSRKGWKKVMEMDQYYDDEKTEFAHFIDAKADMQLLDEEARPYPEITVKNIGGHTEFSQVLLFENDDQKYMMAGDVLATRGEVNRRFAAKYDFDAKQSMKVRKELTRKAYKENYTLLGYHESHYPLFKLTDFDEEQGYKIEKVQ